MCSYLSKYQSAPALRGLQGLPMKGVLAFCADISVDSATHHIYGTTESLQSTLRTRMYSICLECPVLVSLCTSQAESGICPLLCHCTMVVRRALAFGGGPVWPLLPLFPHTGSGSHFALLQFGGSLRVHMFSGLPGFLATPQ